MSFDITEMTGIAGCILMALYTVVSFPVVVRHANAADNTRNARLAFLLLGAVAYSVMGSYALLQHYYLIAFAQVLGVLKYVAVLIQILLNTGRK